MKSVLIAFLALALPACGARPSIKAPVAVPAAAPVERTFVGVLPCPFECAGVRTELTLYDAGRRFLLVETFGLRDGDRVEKSAGEWSVLRGHGANAKADVFELISEAFDEERYFLKVSRDELRALDRQGNEIKTKENVTLRRVKKT